MPPNTVLLPLRTDTKYFPEGALYTVFFSIMYFQYNIIYIRALDEHVSPTLIAIKNVEGQPDHFNLN